jgi:cell division protein FtsZ
VLRQGVQGISDIITMPGLINQDFADVRAIMKDAGSALMGIGRATGENRAVEAAQQAIASPLLELDIHGAQGILWNITGSSNLSLYEVNEAAEAIKEAADPEANIIFGTSFNERLGEEVMVTVIATGFDGGKKRPSVHREATGVMDTSGSTRASHERDFLEELQRQRQESTDGSPFASPEQDDEAAAVVSVPRVERSVGEVAPSRRQTTYDADDLEIPSFLRRK